MAFFAMQFYGSSFQFAGDISVIEAIAQRYCDFAVPVYDAPQISLGVIRITFQSKLPKGPRYYAITGLSMCIFASDHLSGFLRELHEFVLRGSINGARKQFEELYAHTPSNEVG